MKIGVDYFVVLFFCSGVDLNYVWEFVEVVGCYVKICVKVECVEMVVFDEVMVDIISVLDVVMVVCGDLGVEIGDVEFVGV